MDYVLRTGGIFDLSLYYSQVTGETNVTHLFARGVWDRVSPSSGLRPFSPHESCVL